MAPLLEQVAPEAPGPRFDAARRALALGQWGSAWEQCAKLEKEKDAALAETAKKLATWIDGRGETLLAEADAARTQGALMDAIDVWTDLEKTWRGPTQKAARAKLSELKKDKEGKKALEARPFWEKARDAEARKDKKAAFDLYWKVFEICKGTRTGEEAESRAKANR